MSKNAVYYKNLFFLILTLYLSESVFANMASPLVYGTFTASAFTSYDLDIFSEKIVVKPDKEFQTARYVIDYQIYSDTFVLNTPLLFYAKDFLGEFRVWLNNEEVRLRNIPNSYFSMPESAFRGFSHIFKKDSDQERYEVEISWGKDYSIKCNLNDLKFFELNLTKGVHVIRVEYVAKVWTDRTDWVKKYSFRYSLSPARYWKSFGTLDLWIDGREMGHGYQLNLGEPDSGNIETIAKWTFHTIPDDFIEVFYQPEINRIAKVLISLKPPGLALIMAFLLIITHFLVMKYFRKRTSPKKRSWVVLTGGLLIPLIITLFYIFSFAMIDNLIGQHASRYHGYYFLVMLIYPVAAVIYSMIVLKYDKTSRNKIDGLMLL